MGNDARFGELQRALEMDSRLENGARSSETVRFAFDENGMAIEVDAENGSVTRTERMGSESMRNRNGYWSATGSAVVRAVADGVA